jgi:hypothetical protein
LGIIVFLRVVFLRVVFLWVDFLPVGTRGQEQPTPGNVSRPGELSRRVVAGVAGQAGMCATARRGRLCSGHRPGA